MLGGLTDALEAMAPKVGVATNADLNDQIKMTYTTSCALEVCSVNFESTVDLSAWTGPATVVSPLWVFGWKTISAATVKTMDGNQMMDARWDGTDASGHSWKSTQVDWATVKAYLDGGDDTTWMITSKDNMMIPAPTFKEKTMTGKMNVPLATAAFKVGDTWTVNVQGGWAQDADRGTFTGNKDVVITVLSGAATLAMGSIATLAAITL